MHLSSDLGKLLNITDQLAQKRGDQYIASELFVLAALDDKGALGALLKEAGASKNGVEQAIESMRGGQNVDDPNAEEQRQALEKYTVDVTERAEQGKLDPVIGRDEEIRRTIQVLQRRTKNNPVLIGEPGVGKLPSLKALHNASLTTKSLRVSAINVFCPWILVRCLRVRSIAESSKSASKQCSMI